AESECSPPDKILRLRDRIEVSRYSTGFVRLAPLFDDKFSEAPLSDSSYGSTHDHSSDIDSSCIDSSWVGAHSEVRLTPTLGSFHGVRHLSPQRPRASFVDSHRSALKSQLESLRSINRKAELKPPFVHRPNSRYLSSVLVVGDAKHESLLGDEA
ncbi:MAG: hypothetical protein KDD60_13045, partial [Bdellovibrionales bacterium]|nr:hypothetical protein [Bdellovibrionales bacterium]